MGRVLVEWLGLEPDAKSWEDISTISQVAPSSNLEDKVNSDGIGDVTVALDLTEVLHRLQEDLEIIEPTQAQDLEGTTTNPDLSSTHLTRTRKAKHDPNFVYY